MLVWTNQDNASTKTYRHRAPFLAATSAIYYGAPLRRPHRRKEADIYTLGIDVGTGGTRALILNERGAVAASATEEHEPFASPQIGWAEQNPEDWWRACCIAVPKAIERGRLRAEDIVCVGFSGQMHGAVMLDAHGKVVRPALIWCDVRTNPQCEELTAKIGAAQIIQATCNPALANFTLTKLMWVREHEPENWKRVHSIMLPKDYVRFRMTAERATDMADASGTLLLDVAHRRWSKLMLEAAAIDERSLPALFESPEVCGKVNPEGAKALGLRPGTPVVAGAGDQAAGAVGMGIVAPGTVSATIGTSGVVFAATDRPALEPGGRLHTFCHAIPGRWHVMGVTQSAGLSLRWFRDQFGTAGGDVQKVGGEFQKAGGEFLKNDGEAQKAGGEFLKNDARDPYDRLTAEAAKAPAGCQGLLWTPYLMGERTPHLDPNARGALVGLTATHTRAHVIRAILEGVAFSLRDSFTLFDEMKVAVRRIRLGGGGARSPLWRQIQADVYGREVEIVEAEEGAAYGAAILAGVGAGFWNSVDEACSAVVRVAKTVEPQPAAVSVMNANYAAFRRVYPATKAIFAS